MIKKIHC